MARKNRLFAKLASDVDTSGNLAASGIQSEALDTGVTVYATRASLPTSGNTAGDQAYVTGNNRLYIWNGSGWYNIALLNVAPSIQSVLDSGGGTTPFSLAIDGTATTITITAADSDGDPITYSSTADSDFSGLAIISQADNVFTITPFSQDSATTSAGTITFTATDGINIASSGVQTFTLYFVSPYWDETVLSVGTSSTNSLDNSTFIDRSTNAHTVTPTGSPVQTAFHPYLDNWSVEFDGGSSQHVQLRSYSSTPLYSSNDDLTIECWVYSRTSSVLGLFDGTPSQAGGIRNYPANAVAVVGGTSCTFTLPTFEWAHFAAVFDSTSITVYINGTSSNTVSHSGYASKVNFDIGTINGGGDGKFNGYISDFRITTEKLYTSNFTPPTGKLTQLINTTFLGLQNNRFMAADNVYGGTINAVNGAAISSYNPFGQLSEYTSGANKGSVYGYPFRVWTTSVETSLLNPQFTVECWFYATANTGSTQIEIFKLGYTNRGFGFRYRNGNLQAIDKAITVYEETMVENQWYHIAVEKRSDDTFRYYINGQIVHTLSAASTTLNNTEALSVGGVNLVTWNSDTSFYGYISDLKMTRGLSYNGAFTPPTAPVTNTNSELYLPMDNAGIFDKTGNESVTLVGVTTSTTQTKYADTSYYIASASSNYIGLDTLPDFGRAPFTLEMWIYPTATNTNMVIFDTRPSSSLGFSLNFNGGTGMSVYSEGSTRMSVTNVISTNTWNHIALVFDGTNATAYSNGTAVASPFSIGSSSPWSASQKTLGAVQYTPRAAASGFVGYIEGFQLLIGVTKYTTNFTPPTGTQGRTYQAES